LTSSHGHWAPFLFYIDCHSATVSGQKKKKKNGATHAPLIHLSSSIYFKKVDFKQKSVFDVTSETPFYLKSIFLSKRGGQREDEGRIFSISQKKNDSFQSRTLRIFLDL
jgi:hypothetical protein